MCTRPLIAHIENGVVTTLCCNYMAATVGRAISRGIMKNPVQFRTHGGRPSDIANGKTPIDVAFIAAPACDPMGNSSGKYGKSACGSLGYSFVDAVNAENVVVVTDNLVPYPCVPISISQMYVDYVVKVEEIGDPKKIGAGATRMTKNPRDLLIAQRAADVIAASRLFKDGYSFQTGAGGASLAAASFLNDIMLRENIRGICIWFYLRHNLFDIAVFVNDKCGAYNAH